MPATTWSELYKFEEALEASVVAAISAANPAVQVESTRSMANLEEPFITVEVASGGATEQYSHFNSDTFMTGWNVKLDVSVITSRPAPRGATPHGDLVGSVREILTKDIGVMVMPYHSLEYLKESSADHEVDEDDLHDLTNFSFDGVIHVKTDAFPNP